MQSGCWRLSGPTRTSIAPPRTPGAAVLQSDVCPVVAVTPHGPVRMQRPWPCPRSRGGPGAAPSLSQTHTHTLGSSGPSLTHAAHGRCALGRARGCA